MQKKVRFLVMDVDGTLTDGKIYMGANGEAFKVFDVKDGCGIKDILPQYDILPIVITARKSSILQNRCAELEIHYLYQGIRDKLQQLDKILKMQSEQDNAQYTYSDVAYIGDDILDWQCMETIKNSNGIVGCPADAIKEIKGLSHYICEKNGGNGAVREFIEWLIESEKHEKTSWS